MSEALKLRPGDRLWMRAETQVTIVDVLPRSSVGKTSQSAVLALASSSASDLRRWFLRVADVSPFANIVARLGDSSFSQKKDLPKQLDLL